MSYTHIHPYTVYPLQKGKACILISNRSRSKQVDVFLVVFLFPCHPFQASMSQSCGLVLEGFRSINSLTDSDLDQHRTFSFLFLRSQGLTKSRVLEWKGSRDVPLDMNLTYYLIDMKYLLENWFHKLATNMFPPHTSHQSHTNRSSFPKDLVAVPLTGEIPTCVMSFWCFSACTRLNWFFPHTQKRIPHRWLSPGCEGWNTQ